MPEAAELGDHRSTGDRRSRARDECASLAAVSSCSASPFRSCPCSTSRAEPRARRAGWFPTSACRPGRVLRLALPYHWQIAPNRDLTLTPHVYTGVLPAIEAKYRELNSIGAFQLGGFLTYGTIDKVNPHVHIDAARTSAAISKRTASASSIRSGASPARSGLRPTRPSRAATTSRTTTACATSSTSERISPNSYITIAGWAFEGLRAEDEQKRIPIALPAIDARFRMNDIVGGTLELQANSLAILRHRRAGHAARLSRAPMGPEAPHAVGPASNPDRLWPRRRLPHGRCRKHDRADLSRDGRLAHARDRGAWPLTFNGRSSAPSCGGVQRLVPRVQLVLTPPTSNLDIPNEDARSVDLEDSNLFALNRFPGYDRWEDASRVTYGLDWSLRAAQPRRSTARLDKAIRFRTEPEYFPGRYGT